MAGSARNFHTDVKTLEAKARKRVRAFKIEIIYLAHCGDKLMYFSKISLMPRIVRAECFI